MKSSPTLSTFIPNFLCTLVGACHALSCAGAAATPIAPPPKPVPVAAAKTASFVPGPSPEQIRAAVSKRDDELRQCYLVGTFKDAQLVGTVNVTFTINTQGRVSQTTDSGSNLSDPEVITCVLDVFAGLEFPAGASSETEVTYPVNFGSNG